MDLHDFLLGELFEIWPAEFAHQEERRSQDRAAIGRVALYKLAPPLGVEQVGIALRGILPRDEIRVVADNFEPSASRASRLDPRVPAENTW